MDQGSTAQLKHLLFSSDHIASIYLRIFLQTNCLFLLLLKNSLKPIIRNNFQNTDRNEKREIHKRYCSTEKAKKLIGYEPTVSLQEGIKKIIESGVLQPKWATSEKNYTIDDYL